MIANSKRYKNLIEDVKKLVLDNFSDDFFRLGKRIYFGPSGYDMILYFIARVDCKKRFIIHENPDGVIYYGIDTSGIKFSYDMSELWKEVYALKMEWKGQEVMTNDPFFKDSQYDFYAIQSNHNNITKIPGYQKLRERIIEVNDTIKADVLLDKKQFPTLKKRDMLPIAWMDFDKGQVSMTTNNYSESYRKYTQTVPLQGISGGNFVKGIRACPRFLTIEFDYKNKQ